MKTSKEMQLKILDKMRENVESGMHHYFGIETEFGGEWRDMENDEAFDFLDFGYRIKGYFITINGVEIPKPLEVEDVRDLDKETNYYIVCCASTFYDTVCIRYMNIHKPMFSYLTKEEAIEASKLLFGIKG